MTEMTPDEFRAMLLHAAEAYDEAYQHQDESRLQDTDDWLQESISNVRKQRQILLADGGAD